MRNYALQFANNFNFANDKLVVIEGPPKCRVGWDII